MSDCIQWWRRILPNGYGAVSTRQRSGLLAHRRVYEECFGPIPEGMVIHHECRNRACVNPEHLLMCLAEEHPDCGNVLNRKKTHCARGHEFTPENTRNLRRGERVCRTCERTRAREYQRRRRAGFGTSVRYP